MTSDSRNQQQGSGTRSVSNRYAKQAFLGLSPLLRSMLIHELCTSCSLSQTFEVRVLANSFLNTVNVFSILENITGDSEKLIQHISTFGKNNDREQCTTCTYQCVQLIEITSVYELCNAPSLHTICSSRNSFYLMTDFFPSKETKIKSNEPKRLSLTKTSFLCLVCA